MLLSSGKSSSSSSSSKGGNNNYARTTTTSTPPPHIDFYWQRPLGAADHIQRLTAIVKQPPPQQCKQQRRQRRHTNTISRPWALPLTLEKLLVKIQEWQKQQQHSNNNNNKNVTIELDITSDEAVCPEYVQYEWKSICQALAASSTTTTKKCVITTVCFLWNEHNNNKNNNRDEFQSFVLQQWKHSISHLRILYAYCSTWSTTNNNNNTTTTDNNYYQTFQTCHLSCKHLTALCIQNGSCLSPAECQILFQYLVPKIHQLELFPHTSFPSKEHYHWLFQYLADTNTSITHVKLDWHYENNNIIAMDELLQDYLQWNVQINLLRRGLLQKHKQQRRRQNVLQQQQSRQTLSLQPIHSAKTKHNNTTTTTTPVVVVVEDEMATMIETVCTVLKDWYRSTHRPIHFPTITNNNNNNMASKTSAASIPLPRQTFENNKDNHQKLNHTSTCQPRPRLEIVQGVVPTPTTTTTTMTTTTSND